MSSSSVSTPSPSELHRTEARTDVGCEPSLSAARRIALTSGRSGDALEASEEQVDLMLVEIGATDHRGVCLHRVVLDEVAQLLVGHDAEHGATQHEQPHVDPGEHVQRNESVLEGLGVIDFGTEDVPCVARRHQDVDHPHDGEIERDDVAAGEVQLLRDMQGVRLHDERGEPRLEERREDGLSAGLQQDLDPRNVREVRQVTRHCAAAGEPQ